MLDTDILSEVLKGIRENLLAQAREYLSLRQRFAFSAMTQYEFVRGIRAAQAVRQPAIFLSLVDESEVIPISIAILDQASRLWAEAHISGHPRDDGDLIIAATAMKTRSILVTGNTAHFSFNPQERIADWRQA